MDGIRAHLGDHLTRLSKVCTASDVAAREKVLDEARADVVAHLVELLVHLRVVLVVLYELHHEGAVCHREQFCILYRKMRRDIVDVGGKGTHDLFRAPFPEVFADGLVLFTRSRHCQPSTLCAALYPVESQSHARSHLLSIIQMSRPELQAPPEIVRSP